MTREDFIKTFSDQDEQLISKKLNRAIQENTLFKQAINLDKQPINAFGYTLTQIPRITFDRIQEITGYSFSSKDYAKLLLGASRSLELRLLLHNLFRYLFTSHPSVKNIQSFQQLFPQAELNLCIEEAGNVMSYLPIGNVYPWNPEDDQEAMTEVKQLLASDKITLANVAAAYAGFQVSNANPSAKGNIAYSVRYNFTSKQIQSLYDYLLEKNPEYKIIEDVPTDDLVILNWKCECVMLTFLKTCSSYPIIKVCLENKVYGVSQIKYKQDDSFQVNIKVGD